MTKEAIPFDRVHLTGHEETALGDVLRSGVLGAGGPYARRCEGLLAEQLGAGRAFLTGSGTRALELAALLLDLKEGDEFIVPAFTFVSTAGALALRGARPVFVDVDPRTASLDPALLEAAITPRTRAIVPVHYGGAAADLDVVVSIARRHALAVVEDNAQGLFGRYRGRYLGTFGDVAALSFDSSKNVTCGEGGALLVNDPRLLSRAEVVTERGTDRAAFLRREVGEYTWVGLGSAFGPGELAAALLWSQLQDAEAIQSTRQRIWRTYDSALRDPLGGRGIRTPFIHPEAEHPAHLFYLLLPDRRRRDALVAHLRREGIHAVAHFPPLHLSPFARALSVDPRSCPVAEDISGRLVRLPLYPDLSESDQRRVIETVLGSA